MIKKVIFMLALSMFCVDIMAQNVPTPNEGSSQRGIRGSQVDEQPAPIAPATLLLLGLGGATVGTMVYRNTKKN